MDILWWDPFNNEWRSVTVNKPTATATITGLTNGTNYDFTLKPCFTDASYIDEVRINATPVPFHTVTFNSNGGSSVDSQSVAQGGFATEPAEPTKEGYVFSGWYTDNNVFSGGYRFDDTSVTANITLYAKWVANIYTITFDKQGGTGGSDTVTATYGAALYDALAPTNAGYLFGGYYTGTDGNGTQYYGATMNKVKTSYDTAGDITLYAKWTEGYTVTFNSNGGSSVDSQIVIPGSTATEPTAPIKSDIECAFDGWYTDDTTFANLYNFTTAVTANITLYAKWKTTFALGDTGPGGGKIFYVSSAGFTYYQTASDTVGVTAHYLEAAPADSGMKAWASSEYTASYISNMGTALGTGRKNTLLILATDSAAPAALACKNLTTGGKSDWFLPSKDELNQLYTNRSYVGNLDTSSVSGYYLSSSQNDNNHSWYQNFFSGPQEPDFKYLSFKVRAVRAF
jgi:uncharacterized repeat protein (TIGR02543 family)